MARLHLLARFLISLVDQPRMTHCPPQGNRETCCGAC